MPTELHVTGAIIIPFTDGNSEAQRGDTTCPQSSTCSGMEREASVNLSHPASSVRSLLGPGDRLSELASRFLGHLSVCNLVCTGHVSWTLWFCLCLWITRAGPGTIANRDRPGEVAAMIHEQG